ncbi:unnamed protein product [Clavelina lepadiformis]|uniref:Uncharacterized protein n=1 Tax=Clavelina lepadiformis TaxID=159417 RepID=A0ABP0GNK2_CLALP
MTTWTRSSVLQSCQKGLLNDKKKKIPKNFKDAEPGYTETRKKKMRSLVQGFGSVQEGRNYSIKDKDLQSIQIEPRRLNVRSRSCPRNSGVSNATTHRQLVSKRKVSNGNQKKRRKRQQGKKCRREKKTRWWWMKGNLTG